MVLEEKDVFSLYTNNDEAENSLSGVAGEEEEDEDENEDKKDDDTEDDSVGDDLES